MTHSLFQRAAVAVVCLTILSGCTSGNDPSPPAGGKKATFAPLPGGEPALDSAIVAAADPAKVTMPLASYDLDDATATIVSRARIIVGDRCMAQFGLKPVPNWKPEGAVGRNDWARWGIWDLTRASRFGYLPPEENSGNPYPVRFLGQDGNAVYFGSVTVYKGQAVPTGGCAAQEAAAVLGPDDPNAALGYLTNDLDTEAISRATADHRVTPLLAAWHACVKSAGWDFADPQAPIAYWSTRRGDDKQNPVVSDEERRSALADIGCKKSTKLLGVWLAADVSYQRALIERDSEKLRAYQQRLDAMVDRANKIIAGG